MSSSTPRSFASRVSGLGIALWLSGLVLAAPAAAWRAEVDPSQASDSALHVVVDGAGDVIASGSANRYYSTNDALIIKFAGGTGTEVWRQQIDNTYLYSANAVVDGANDVFAYIGAATIAKYAGSNGAELWRQVISDVTGPLATDQNGDLIVGGKRYNAGAFNDFMVIKLAGGNGMELWRYETAGTQPGDDAATAVAVDGAGDVIAVGGVYNGGSSNTLLVVKLAGSTGGELWRHTVPDASDVGGAVSIGANGDVVVGGVVPASNGVDFGVFKLAAATGNDLWRHVVNGTASMADYSTAVRVDAAGDVLAVGLLNNTETQEDFAVLKLARDTGMELWRREIDGRASAGDWARSVTVDAAGDVFATGYLTNLDITAETDLAVVKLAGSTGADLWRQEIDGTEVGSSDLGLALATAPGGDAIVAGILVNKATDDDFAVLRLGSLDGAVGPVRGEQLRVKDKAGDASKRRISASSGDQAVVIPPPGSVGDPTVWGATLRIVNPTTLEAASFALPGGSEWRALGSPPGALGYKYTDAKGLHGPCRGLFVRPGFMRLLCLGRRGPIPFTLDEPTQGSLTISVQLGSAEPQCATFGGTVSHDAGTANPGPLGLFRAADAPPVSGNCP